MLDPVPIGVLGEHVIKSVLDHPRPVARVTESGDRFIDIAEILFYRNIVPVSFEYPIVVPFEQDLAGFGADRLEMARHTVRRFLDANADAVATARRLLRHERARFRQVHRQVERSALQSYGSGLDWIDRCPIAIMRRSTDSLAAPRPFGAYDRDR